MSVDWIDALPEEPDEAYCLECGQECKPVEIEFHYSGSHCTYGRAGIYSTGIYESPCCGGTVGNYFDLLDNLRDNE